MSSTDLSSHPDLLSSNLNCVWERGKHIAQLDGVRGLAILIVTLYRFAKEMPTETFVGELLHKVLSFGDRGVDLFFVLSGFLITGILVDAKSKDGYFRNFYARRSLRIFPLYFFALFLFLIVFSWFPPFGSLFSEATQKQGYLWSYTSNIRMSLDNAWNFGYLDHFWSLAVEEHFYLVWPFVIFCCTQKTAMRVAIGVAILSALSRIGFATLTENGVAPNVLTLFRCDALLLGAIVAMQIRSENGIKPLLKWSILAMLICLPIALAAEWLDKRLVSIPNTLWPIVWTCVLLWVLNTRRTSLLARFFEVQGLRTLGKYSYAMYVFQLPLIPLTAGIVSVARLTQLFGDGVVGTLAYVGIMFVLTYGTAIMSWHLLEKHFLRMKDWFGGSGSGAKSTSTSTMSSVGHTIAGV